MKKIKVFILIGFIIIGILTLTGCVELNTATENGVNNNQTVKEIKECEHDWVMTSEYDWVFGGHRIISKCSKCGKKIK